MAAKKEHYVSRAEFEGELKAFYDSGNETPCDGLCIKIQKIATGLSFSRNFIRYSYRDEMVGDAVIKMYAALKNKKFRFETGSSPFSYFTTIAYNEFLSRLKKENRNHETIAAYRDQVYEDLMTNPENNGGHIYVRPNSDQFDDE